MPSKQVSMDISNACEYNYVLFYHHSCNIDWSYSKLGVHMHAILQMLPENILDSYG